MTPPTAPAAQADVDDVIIDTVASLFESSTWADPDALNEAWDALLLQDNWDALLLNLDNPDFGAVLFNEYFYTPLHMSIDTWLDSSEGHQFASIVNSVSGQYLIGDGTDGTADNPNGGNAGLLFGDGGSGYGSTQDKPIEPAIPHIAAHLTIGQFRQENSAFIKRHDVRRRRQRA